MKTIKFLALIALAVVMAIVAINFKVMLMLGGQFGIAISVISAIASVLAIALAIMTIFNKNKIS